VRAKGIFTFLTRYISTIDISEPCFNSNLPCSMKHRGRRPWKIQHFIGGIESGDMPGDFWPQGEDELGDLIKLVI
jgi:hypothetical protein